MQESLLDELFQKYNSLLPIKGGLETMFSHLENFHKQDMAKVLHQHLEDMESTSTEVIQA